MWLVSISSLLLIFVPPFMLQVKKVEEEKEEKNTQSSFGLGIITFIITALIKVFLIATFMSSTHTFLNEVFRASLYILDLIAYFVIFKYNITSDTVGGRLEEKIPNLVGGWSFVESLLTHVIPIISSIRRNEDFSFEFFYVGIESNIKILMYMSIVTLMFLYVCKKKFSMKAEALLIMIVAFNMITVGLRERFRILYLIIIAAFHSFLFYVSKSLHEKAKMEKSYK